MGPFELMDLVGVDTGLEISKSFYEQSFYEPRWRPSPISARYVAAGLHGRKTGRGYYDYSGVPTATGPGSGPPQPPVRDAIVQGDGRSAAGARANRCPGDGTGPGRSLSTASAAAWRASRSMRSCPWVLVEVTGEAGELAFGDLGLHTARVQPSPVGRAPADRVPGDQRVRLRARRRGRQRGGHRRRHGARAQPPARAARMGRRDRVRHVLAVLDGLGGVPRGALPPSAGAAPPGAVLSTRARPDARP